MRHTSRGLGDVTPSATVELRGCPRACSPASSRSAYTLQPSQKWRRCEVGASSRGSVDENVGPPVFDIAQAPSSESKRHTLRSSSPRRPSNDVIQALCHAEPGSMKSESVLLNRPRSAASWTTNSRTLSTRTKCGVPMHKRQPIQRIDHAIGVDAATHLNR